jgi:[ribosomal protein S18]-alanine N-acetyltransferase
LHAAWHTVGAKFNIRDYRPADFETLWSIDQRCFPSGISYSRSELTSFLTQRNAITLVAENVHADSSEFAGVTADPAAVRVLGFVIAHRVRRRYARILTLDVLSEARRSGLGQQLMSNCEERLRAAGCSEVYLETAVDNEPALRLYRKLGYEVLGILPEYYASHGLDAFRMAKRL